MPIGGHSQYTIPFGRDLNKATSTQFQVAMSESDITTKLILAPIIILRKVKNS